MIGKAVRRFYKQAEAVAHAGGGFGVHLDGRAVRTPGKALLVVPAEALARALAEEWQAQGETVQPFSMPLNRLAFTAIDRIGPQRAAIVEGLLDYLHGDMLCYRADSPLELALRQAALWQPALDWAARDLDALLTVTAGLMPVTQPEAAGAALGAALHALDDHQLSAVQDLASLTKSLVLALAVAHGRLSGDEVVAAAEVDDRFQLEQWGEDAEALERLAKTAEEITAAVRFIELLRG